MNAAMELLGRFSGVLVTDHYSGYNASVNPTVANAFASAALRFGHSLIKNTLSRSGATFQKTERDRFTS